MDWVNHMIKINNKFKFQLFGKNASNLQKCYDNIPKFDPQQCGTMTTHTFNLFLNSFGIFFTTQQITKVKDRFCEGDAIKYIDFIENVRRDITPKRLATIDHCFEELATDGVISIDKLLNNFHPANHPHVRCMLKTVQQVRNDFQSAIRKRSADGKHLNEIQFKEYYLDVNACVPLQRQQFFVDILINGFKLMDSRVTLDRLRQIQVTIFEKVRQKTYLKKDEGTKSKADFRFFDMEDKGVVDYGRFVQTLQRLGCKFTPKQLKALYWKHAGSDNILTYEQMCALLFEMGSGVKDNTNPIYEMSKTNNQVSVSHGMTKRYG